ncbi:MAG: hypothetical protein OXH84_02835 [Gammaproteobacteria bacterium]|nr:hypothetical protein [Gammaproteobacteria bacterium]
MNNLLIWGDAWRLSLPRAINLASQEVQHRRHIAKHFESVNLGELD